MRPKLNHLSFVENQGKPSADYPEDAFLTVLWENYAVRMSLFGKDREAGQSQCIFICENDQVYVQSAGRLEY